MRRVHPNVLQQDYPGFYRWLMDLAPTHAQRAQILEIDMQTIIHWQSGRGTPTPKSLRKRPEGLRIIADDLEAQHERC